MIDNPIVVRWWHDISMGWRSRWLRYSLETDVTHVTIQVGQDSLHTDYNHCAWYPTMRLWGAYEKAGSYKLGGVAYFDSADVDYVKDRVYKPGHTWSAIRWRYFMGPPPQTCVANVASILRECGYDVPTSIITAVDMREYCYDHCRIFREGTYR